MNISVFSQNIVNIREIFFKTVTEMNKNFSLHIVEIRRTTFKNIIINKQAIYLA